MDRLVLGRSQLVLLAFGGYSALGARNAIFILCFWYQERRNTGFTFRAVRRGSIVKTTNLYKILA